LSEDKPYELLKPDSEEIKRLFFAGYETQMKAGLGVLCQVLQDSSEKVNSNYKILAFGMPGVGKSSYPKALVKGLFGNSDTKGFLAKIEKSIHGLNSRFSLFQVRCLGILTTYTDLASLKKVLSLLERSIVENTPAIVVFDELDAFSPEKRDQSEYLSYWTMNFVKRELPGLAIFGIVNYPDKLDPAVYRKFEHLFYFKLPDVNTVAEILEHFDIPSSQEIAEKLCANPVDAGELMTGCKVALKFRAAGISRNLRSIDPEELADFIAEHLKMPWEKVRDYGLDYTYYIDKAVKNMEFWVERRNLLVNEGK